MKYKATIDILGKKFTSEGKTAKEAIANLKPQGIAKGKSILVVTNGKDTKERVLNPLVVNRLFNLSPAMREVALKNLGMLYDI